MKPANAGSETAEAKVCRVADQAGTNTGNATVVVRAAQKISITSPADGTKYTTSPSGVSVLGSASDADGTINKVVLFVNGYATATNNSTSTTFSWSTNVLGYYNLVTEATDNHGQRTKSSPVSVRYDSQSTTNLIARITNLTNSQETLTTLTNVDYPTIREGFFAASLRWTAFSACAAGSLRMHSAAR